MNENLKNKILVHVVKGELDEMIDLLENCFGDLIYFKGKEGKFFLVHKNKKTEYFIFGQDLVRDVMFKAIEIDNINVLYFLWNDENLRIKPRQIIKDDFRLLCKAIDCESLNSIDFILDNTEVKKDGRYSNEEHLQYAISQDRLSSFKMMVSKIENWEILNKLFLFAVKNERKSFLEYFILEKNHKLSVDSESVINVNDYKIKEYVFILINKKRLSEKLSESLPENKKEKTLKL